MKLSSSKLSRGAVMFQYLLAMTMLVALYMGFIVHKQIERDPKPAVLSMEEFRRSSVKSSSSAKSSVAAKNEQLQRVTTGVVNAAPASTVKPQWNSPMNFSSLGELKGALDEHGLPGYIHDPTYIRRKPPPFNSHPDVPAFNEGVCDMPPGTGIEGGGGIHGLRKIQIYNESIPDTKILCMVYTHEGAHDYALQAVIETYAPRCDGFLAASNATDLTMGAVNILKKGPEAYGNMWQKTRSIWQYVYDNYLDEFDWFHLGGDNMFIIAENLRLACHQETQRQLRNGRKAPFPVYMGGAMVLPPRRKWRLCGGGAGYTLNREAVRRMVRDEFNQSHCQPDTMSPKEDLLIANCLRPNIGQCEHSVDEKLEARYHPYDVEFHATWKRWKVSNWHWKLLKEFHHIDLSQEELKGIAASAVSFHLTGHKNITTRFRDMGMRRYHALLYGLCPNHEYVPFDPNVTIFDVRTPTPPPGVEA